jgi:hypothetical protein
LGIAPKISTTPRFLKRRRGNIASELIRQAEEKQVPISVDPNLRLPTVEFPVRLTMTDSCDVKPTYAQFRCRREREPGRFYNCTFGWTFKRPLHPSGMLAEHRLHMGDANFVRNLEPNEALMRCRASNRQTGCSSLRWAMKLVTGAELPPRPRAWWFGRGSAWRPATMRCLPSVDLPRPAVVGRA